MAKHTTVSRQKSNGNTYQQLPMPFTVKRNGYLSTLNVLKFKNVTIARTKTNLRKMVTDPIKQPFPNKEKMDLPRR